MAMMTVAPVMIRPVRPEDVSALVQLATLLDTVNLPRDPALIAEIITESATSFARLAQPPPDREDAQPPRGTYTLVAMQGEQLLGTASLLSPHGTASDPHYALRVVEHTFHSTQLNIESFRHL